MSTLQQMVVFEITNSACVPDGASPAQLVRARANRWVDENKDRIVILQWEPTDSGGLLGYRVSIIYEVMNGEEPTDP